MRAQMWVALLREGRERIAIPAQGALQTGTRLCQAWAEHAGIVAENSRFTWVKDCAV